jgi:hypothetical protein
MFTTAGIYTNLDATFRKGLRNGNWRKLKFLDKALYRAAIGYAKRGGSIVNGMLVEKHSFQKEIFTNNFFYRR